MWLAWTGPQAQAQKHALAETPAKPARPACKPACKGLIGFYKGLPLSEDLYKFHLYILMKRDMSAKLFLLRQICGSILPIVEHKRVHQLRTSMIENYSFLSLKIRSWKN